MSRHRVDIELRIDDRGVLSDLFGKPDPARGDTASVGGDVTLTYRGRKAAFRGSVEAIVMLVASIPVNVTASVLAAWLYDKLKSRRVVTISIEGTRVPVDEQELEKVISEKISA